MPRDPLIALVGKPSAGKSTMLNSLTDATSKVGNFPFTTIDPQRAIGYLRIPCACTRFNKESQCTPTYGSCTSGQRSVPIELLDVAGLVPGAHLGRGLGNKFLDDLRHADALIHVVDVSGTTDAEGKETRGYDPSEDIVWLRGEIVRWVHGNLVGRWGGVKRRHKATKAKVQDTLLGQFSGYGANMVIINRLVDSLPFNKTTPLDEWSDEQVEEMVERFVDEKFPTVIALNKVDHPDSAQNIQRISKRYPSESLVLCSAVAECFLRKLKKQGFVKYEEGTEFVDTYEDLVADGDASGGGLKPMDEKLKNRIENLRDLVLYRFGSTGVSDVLTRAATVLGLVPIFPVRNIHMLTAPGTQPVFRDCVLVPKNTTVAGVARRIMGDGPIAFVEGADGNRVSEDEIVGVGKHDVLSFKMAGK
ncbi:GTP-binding protein [Ascobolus immersus RN42]|uniref:GTP-binding protein n=1 Tax=Ascobolus immersus RN42 TaxID=1160509 RepID=A0A3N4IGB9_ASCIM|nr:GTP-binding protein [Ascobolus immersus RN42]